MDVIIPITDDLIDESDETFTVDGTVTSGNTSNTTNDSSDASGVGRGRGKVFVVTHTQ